MATSARTKTGSVESAEQEAVPIAANVEEASVPEVAGDDPAPDAEPDVPFKRWIVWKDAQHFEIRTFTPQDWAKVGVENGRTLHWHKGNSFRVSLEEVLGFLTKAQIDQYILTEPRFEIVED